MPCPDFSVITPVYNGARFVVDALESVARQTHGSWECIVADDGSHDDSLQSVEAWQRSTEAEIKVVRHPNGEHRGLPATRNLAAGQAKGQWLAFLDQDDVWDPEKLSEQAEFLRNNPDVDAVSCYPLLTYLDTEPRIYIDLWASSIQDPKLAPDGRIEFARFLTGCPFFMSGAVVRRDAFESIGGFHLQLPYTSDWLLWACLATRKSLGLIQKQLATYRFHGNNAMDRLAGEPLGLISACLDIQEHLIEWIAADRKVHRAEAVRLVRDHVDWGRCAREARIDRDTWWQLLAGREESHG